MRSTLYVLLALLCSITATPAFIFAAAYVPDVRAWLVVPLCFIALAAVMLRKAVRLSWETEQ